MNAGRMHDIEAVRRVPRSQFTRTKAFSLVEMLVVVAILVLLMAIMLPAATSMMGGMNLGRASAMMTDELNFARQTALSRNRDVEVRIYQLGGATEAANKQYRGFRSYLIEGANSNDWKPLSRIKVLPEPIIISDSSTYSTLLNVGGGTSGLATGSENLPGYGLVNYVSFLFRANGGTSLKPVTENWFLTVYSERAKKSGQIPANYFTAQIDPVTGRTRSYRP